MPAETLHFENARLAQQLFNNDPRNLQSLEEHLGVNAVARENWIKLEGPDDALERARELFQSLETLLKNGGAVRQREFSHALNVVEHDGVSALRALFSERITTSSKKAPVAPKTVGQKKYVDAIRRHDVTFGLGPAGTGKTYLAMAMALSALREEKVARIILTRPAVDAGFLYSRWKYGVDLERASPENAVAASRVPILLIHGRKDANLPPRHSEEIQAHNPGVVLWEPAQAGHCGAAGAEPQEYERRLIGWFESHDAGRRPRKP